jgi:hypothetical protein
MAAKADSDGIIRLTIPIGMANEEFEVAIVVSAKPTANGTAKPKTPEELGWPPGFFENTFGSIDDETFCEPTASCTPSLTPLTLRVHQECQTLNILANPER